MQNFLQKIRKRLVTRGKFPATAWVPFFLWLVSPGFAAGVSDESATMDRLLPYAEQARLVWLDIYADVFQKMAFLVISAFVLMRVKAFRPLFEHPEEMPKRESAFLFIGLSALGMVACTMGYYHYGHSDWSFMDVQLVLTAVTGLLLGVRAGLVGGFLASLFRYALNAGNPIYVLTLVSVGLAGGFYHRRFPKKSISRKGALAVGVSASFLHGSFAYFPIGNSLGLWQTISVIAMLVLLESLGLYAFVSVLLSVLADERRRALERLVPQMKLKFLQAQINPHFLFNALNTIAAICSREQAEQARNLVVKLSNFFRRIVKHDDEWVTLEEELEHADSYIEIEKARYQERLQVKKDIRLNKKGLRVEVPVLIIQPIVENAIRHGIAPMTKGGVLTIAAHENDQGVEIEIQDNGVGIPAEKLKAILTNQNGHSRGEGIGIGLSNINERLRYLYGPDHFLKIKSGVGQGTCIQFRIPFESQQKE